MFKKGHARNWYWNISVGGKQKIKKYRMQYIKKIFSRSRIKSLDSGNICVT